MTHKKHFLTKKPRLTTPQVLWVSFKKWKPWRNTPLIEEKCLCTQWSTGICGHQTWQLSFLLPFEVPQQRSQVPFLKETAVTSPNSFNQHFTKWKMATRRRSKDKQGSHERRLPNECCGLFSGWHQGCFILMYSIHWALLTHSPTF